MTKPTRVITVRIVPLHSREAEEAIVGGTAEERLALVARLSEAGWALTGRPVPEYSRASMPVRLISLAESR